MRKFACQLIRWYRLILGTWIGDICRFYPSCSRYTEQAIDQYGVIRGIILGSWRILRCHPWGQGGIDLVPSEEKNNQLSESET